MTSHTHAQEAPVQHVKFTVRHTLAVLAVLLVSMGVATATGRVVKRALDRVFTVQAGEPTVYYPPER